MIHKCAKITHKFDNFSLYLLKELEIISLLSPLFRLKKMRAWLNKTPIRSS